MRTRRGSYCIMHSLLLQFFSNLLLCRESSTAFGLLQTPSTTRSIHGHFHERVSTSRTTFYSKAPPGGIDFEVEEASDSNTLTPTVTSTNAPINPSTISTTAAVATTTSAATTNQQQQQQPLPFPNRAKVNEIDFCMSPSDVSLSRAYGASSRGSSSTSTIMGTTAETNSSSPTQQPRILSLTRAMNNASNRAVRRILLSRSWPSAEALNLSLRQILKKEQGLSDTDNTSTTKNDDEGNTSTKEAQAVVGVGDKDKNNINANDNEPKCPVPRPILNIIVRQSKDNSSSESATTPITETDMIASSSTPSPLTKMKLTNEQWVEQQMKSFRNTYGLLPGYEYADAYMECILSLATSGVESEKVSDVIAGGVYDDSYRRLLAVLRSAGAVFEGELSTKEGTEVSRMKIAPKLRDQDICLSMLDKISIQNEKLLENDTVVATAAVVDDDTTLNGKVDTNNDVALEDTSTTIDPINERIVPEKEEALISNTEIESNISNLKKEEKQKKTKNKKLKDKLLFFMKKVDTENDNEEEEKEEEMDKIVVDETPSKEQEVEETEQIKPEDLGAVLLSAEEPTITRQLNVLSNIVKRALLFGGDQELLVLSETLEADKPAFIQRWYPDSGGIIDPNDLNSETRPGVQFFNCLVQLLKDSYTYGVVEELDPPFPLSSSYYNSYERLTGLLIELGSGYVKPVNTKKKKVLPKTPKEELIRFSQWEVALRQTKPDVSDYPSDLIGSWLVKDEIGGKIIGTSTVVFKSEGEVYVDPPLRGLRWRLDPGPTHLDTCTFQVLNEDGAVIQYKGFLDRGARLESRFSKRAIKIRGAVAFQMRDGETGLMGKDYKSDMLPIDTATGTTRFVMSKVFDLNDD